MSRAGLNEIIPGRLYQRGSFLAWPHSQRWAMLRAASITVVVNVWNKVDPDLSTDDQHITYLVWPLVSTGLPPTTDVVVDMLARLIQSGECLLAHCEAGKNRSAWLCIRLLMAVEGVAAAEARRRVFAAVPGAALRPELERDLRRAEAGEPMLGLPSAPAPTRVPVLRARRLASALRRS